VVGAFAVAVAVLYAEDGTYGVHDEAQSEEKDCWLVAHVAVKLFVLSDYGYADQGAEGLCGQNHVDSHDEIGLHRGFRQTLTRTLFWHFERGR